MSKRMITALMLIALTVIVLLLNNSGQLSLNMMFGTVRAATSMVLLGFTGVGVIIGLLIR